MLFTSIIGGLICLPVMAQEEPVGPPAPATTQAGPSEQEAVTEAALAYIQASRDGDAERLLSLMYATSEYGRNKQDLAIAQAVAIAAMRRAAEQKFGVDAASAAIRGLVIELPEPTGPLRWQIEGDKAIPLPSQPGAVPEGPAGMVRVEGTWRIDLDAGPAVSEAEQYRNLHRMRAVAEMLTVLAPQVEQGQFATPEQFRKELRRRMVEATYGPFGTSRTSTTTQPQ
jgi:hypothetical protein